MSQPDGELHDHAFLYCSALHGIRIGETGIVLRRDLKAREGRVDDVA